MAYFLEPKRRPVPCPGECGKKAFGPTGTLTSHPQARKILISTRSIFDLECGEHRRFRFAFILPSLLGRPKSQSKGRRASGSAVAVLSWLGPTKKQIESGDARRTPNRKRSIPSERLLVRIFLVGRRG